MPVRVFKRQGKCIGAGSLGCMFEQAMSDSDSGDVAKGTLPATHTHVNTKRSGPGIIPTLTSGFNIIMPPRRLVRGIRGLQRQREKAWSDPPLLPGNVAELGEIIFWNATDIVRSPPFAVPLPLHELQLHSYLAYRLGQVFIALFIIQVASRLCGPWGKKDWDKHDT